MSEDKIVDVSGEILKQQRIDERNKLMVERRQGMVELIMRQTGYDEEKAEERLTHWKNNYLHAIKEYINPDFQDIKNTTDPSTKNQMIYGEIRNFMDDVNKQQLQRKRQKEEMEQKKAAYLSYLLKQQSNNIIRTTVAETTVAETTDKQ